MRILREECLGLVIDIQERLLPHMSEGEALLKSNSVLINGLNALQVPLVVTEQYTKGLGVTVDPVKSWLLQYEPFEKTAFSCCDDEAIASKLKSFEKKYVIISGIEAHVCVLQTALDLLEIGLVPVVVEDCVSSRKLNDKRIALDRIAQSGGIITTSESILFELTRKAGSDMFKAISKLVK